MKTIATAAALVLCAAGAQAGDHRFGPANATYRAECGSCHVAYPPQLLSAVSWKALLAGLDKHFGSDASVDAAAMKEIGDYLARNARTPRNGEGIPLRITETRWFVREHDEVPAATWTGSAVKSRANCGACHTQADNLDFGERSLRVPK